MKLFNVIYTGLALIQSLSQAASVTRPLRGSEIVQWDEHSLFINGERLMLLSGEFHP